MALAVTGHAPSCSSTRERGSGTVLILAVLSVAALLAIAAGLVGRAVTARHRAQSAADLAALAAAAAWPQPSCTEAARVAAANGGVLIGCLPGSAGSVTVTVLVPVQILSGLSPARATARAGPASIVST